MTSTDTGDSDLAPEKYLDTNNPDLIRARVRLLESLDDIEVYLAHEIAENGRPGVLAMLRQRAQALATEQDAVDALFESYEEQLAALNADPRPPKGEMARYLVATSDDVQEVDSPEAPDDVDITYVEIIGGKIKLDSPYETKDDIKAMETSNREWTGNYWAISQSYAQQSIDHLTEAGYTLAIHRDVRASLREPLAYDTRVAES